MKNLNSIAIYVLGYVTIEFNGEYCERFLNVLAANGINFRNVKKHKDNFRITILKKDFFKLRKLRKNCNVRIKIIRKQGIPFIINKHKYRYGLLVGFVFLLFTLYLLSSKLWIIKINGNVTINDEEIIKIINELGIHEGMSMHKIDTDILKQSFILSCDNIAWASFNKQGSVLEVNLTEFKNNTQNIASNLVAQYDGIIKKIDVQSGMVNVRIGDTVSKGQLLVSGIVNYGNGANFINPNGKIIAEVICTKTIKIPKKYESVILSDKTDKKHVLNIAGVNFPLYLGKISDNYEKEISTKKLRLFGSEIPVKISTVFCRKKYASSTVLSVDGAKRIALNDLNDMLEKENCTNIAVLDLIVKEDCDDFIFTAKIKFTKNIAINEEISYNIDK